MIRDDGENGIWASHPAVPSEMNKITREEYRSEWGLYSSASQQEGVKSTAEGGDPYAALRLEGRTFDEQKTGPAGKNETKININATEVVPTVIKGAVNG